VKRRSQGKVDHKIAVSAEHPEASLTHIVRGILRAFKDASA